jgi:hemerythrin-like domain-containing protein
MTTELAAGAAVARRFVEQEHRELSSGVAGIEETAAHLEPATAANASHQVRVILDWFAQRLEQHLAWEDAWLYPQLDRLAGTDWLTRLMRFEHEQIRGAFQRLGADWEALPPVPERKDLDALRGRLYGLACVVRSHLEREEWILVPLLGEA